MCLLSIVEYRDARQWIAEELDFSRVGGVSTFEITIRVLGGLLAAYHLTDDALFLDKAVLPLFSLHSIG